VALALIPVVVRGGLHDMIDQAFAGHSDYLAYGGVWYLKPIYSLRDVAGNPFSGRALRFINAAVPFLVPFAAAPMLLIAFVSDREKRALTIAVAAFTAAGFGIVYPRSDPQHMIFAMPLLLLACAYCARIILASFERTAVKSITAFVTGAIAITLAFMTLSAFTRARDSVFPAIPHFRGLMVQRASYMELSRSLASPQPVRARPTLILSPYASFYYLAGAVKNPTRYDYPTIVALRASGTKEIVSGLQNGSIPQVCIADDGDPLLEPNALKQMIRRTMTKLESPRFCDLYAKTAPGTLSSVPNPHP
jgi:hypothetical protein